MEKKTQIEKLRKQETEIRNKIYAIEQEEIDKKQKPRLKAMIGKCFAYRNNSFSCPKDKSDYWDVFRKIIDWVDTEERGFHFILEEISVDSQGKINWSIENVAPYLNKEWWDSLPFSGYEEIEVKEYEAEKLKMLGEMATQRKMRKVLESKYN